MGRYEGEFVAKFLGDGRNIRLTQAFAFIDDAALRWDVPKEAEVDGASIPRVLWTVIGGPFEGKYRDASVIHDYFCDVRTRTSQAVHRMFYEAMIASGVAQTYARLLYTGVCLGGPRWSPTVVANMAIMQAQQGVGAGVPAAAGPDGSGSGGGGLADAFVALPLLPGQYAALSRQFGHQGADEVDAGWAGVQEVYHYQLKPEDLHDLMGIAESGLSLDEIDGAVQQRTDGATPSTIGVELKPTDGLESGMPALKIGPL